MLQRQRRGRVVERELRQTASRWTGRPITSIQRQDVIEAINEVLDREAIYSAHNLFGNLRRFSIGRSRMAAMGSSIPRATAFGPIG